MSVFDTKYLLKLYTIKNNKSLLVLVIYFVFFKSPLINTQNLDLFILNIMFTFFLNKCIIYLNNICFKVFGLTSFNKVKDNYNKTKDMFGQYTLN